MSILINSTIFQARPNFADWFPGLLVVAIFLALCCPAAHSAPELQQPGGPEFSWRDLAPGLEMGALSESGEAPKMLIVLRIDPERYNIDLFSASQGESGEKAGKTLTAWAEEKNLIAAINAGMYLPDNLTHTGYLRIGEHVNNLRKGGRLGAFFVAHPRQKGLPQADILETDQPGLEKRLTQYDHVVQNFRLLDKEANILWSDASPKNPIAAVGKDRQGRILFILSQYYLSAADLGRALKDLPLDVSSTMYVEGGGKAALYVKENKKAAPQLWTGRQAGLSDNDIQPLPNIIGVTPR